MLVAKLAPTTGAAQATVAEPASSQGGALGPLLLLLSVGALVVGLVLAGVVIWLLVRGRKAEGEAGQKV